MTRDSASDLSAASASRIAVSAVQATLWYASAILVALSLMLIQHQSGIEIFKFSPKNNDSRPAGLIEPTSLPGASEHPARSEPPKPEIVAQLQNEIRQLNSRVADLSQQASDLARDNKSLLSQVHVLVFNATTESAAIAESRRLAADYASMAKIFASHAAAVSGASDDRQFLSPAMTAAYLYNEFGRARTIRGNYAGRFKRPPPAGPAPTAWGAPTAVGQATTREPLLFNDAPAPGPRQRTITIQ